MDSLQQKKQRFADDKEHPKDSQTDEGNCQLAGYEAGSLIPGEVYLAFRGVVEGWSVVLLLPIKKFWAMGIPDALQNIVALWEDIPQCYENSPRDYGSAEITLRLRSEYKDDRSLFPERQCPVMFFDGLNSPEESSFGWVCAKDFRSFDVNNPKLCEHIRHLWQVREFLENRKDILVTANDENGCSPSYCYLPHLTIIVRHLLGERFSQSPLTSYR